MRRFAVAWFGGRRGPIYYRRMGGSLFDVFVVGSTDPSAAGETRLAAALSAKHGVPLPTVAKAIAAKNLRAGQSLEQGQAQALVKQLQTMGAVTVIRPAMGRPASSPVAPAPAARPASPVPGTTRPVATPSPGSGWPGAAPTPLPPAVSAGTGFAMPAAGAPIADQFGPLDAAAAPRQTSDADPFQPRRVTTPVLGVSPKARASVTPPPSGHQAHPSGSGLALDITPGPRLELARGGRDVDDEGSAVKPRPTTSAASLREMDAGGTSGVAMDEDPRNLNLVRCVQHGLYYDKTKASGCRKCLSSAREAVMKMEAKTEGFQLGDFRRKPAKRAFLGLLFALVLGFLPAAYYCFGPGTTEVRRLRVEQELLSRQPGTEEILRRFDELDAQVGDSHGRSTRNTAIVWVAVASVAMLGWYKVT